MSFQIPWLTKPHAFPKLMMILIFEIQALMPPRTERDALNAEFVMLPLENDFSWICPALAKTALKDIIA